MHHVHRPIGFRFLLFGMGSATHIASRIRNYSSKLELMAVDLHVRADFEKALCGVYLAAEIFSYKFAREIKCE